MQKKIFLIGLFLFAGCMSQANSPSGVSKVTDSASYARVTSPSSNNSVSPALKVKNSASLPKELKKGMAYGDLRSLALSNGWIPRVHPSCKKGVVGAAFEKICASNPKRCEACDLAPELSECSGDGYCLMEFTGADGGKFLTVATYGEIEDVLMTGKDSRLQVTSWEVKSIK